MKKRFPIFKLAAIFCLLAAMMAASCAPQETGNTNTANSNMANKNASAQNSGTPAEAKPMGAEAPGYYMAGPTGDVSLKFTQPPDGETIQGDSIAPTFTISGYPIYKDDERNKGQHIHVILDNEPYEADYKPGEPFNPAKFQNLKEGTHTLRAFPSREWHESIKETDASDFDMVVFNVKSASPGVKVDKAAPLLTYSRPKGEYKWNDHPKGVMLDFYVTNATLGPNDYKVKYTLDSKAPQIVTRWEPIWWKWEELGAGQHKIVLELLDKDSKPVPFKVGNTDYNHTERTFTVLAQGQMSSGNSNANSNTSGH